MQANDKLIEQPFGVCRLAATGIHDAAYLDLLNVARCKFGCPCLVELVLRRSSIEDELSNQTNRVCFFVFGDACNTVGKIETFHQAQEDTVEIFWIADVPWTRGVIPEKTQTGKLHQTLVTARLRVIQHITHGGSEPVGAEDDDVVQGGVIFVMCDVTE